MGDTLYQIWIGEDWTVDLSVGSERRLLLELISTDAWLVDGKSSHGIGGLVMVIEKKAHGSREDW